jgi:hypothetical protein
VLGERRAHAVQHVELRSLDIDLHDVGRRDAARRDEAVDAQHVDLDGVRGERMAAAALEVRPALVGDDVQPFLVHVGAERRLDHLDVRPEAVELGVHAHRRGAVGCRLECDHVPVGAGEPRGEDGEEADVRADVVDGGAGRDRAPEGLLDRQLGEAADERPGLRVGDGQMGQREPQAAAGALVDQGRAAVQPPAQRRGRRARRPARADRPVGAARPGERQRGQEVECPGAARTRERHGGAL